MHPMNPVLSGLLNGLSIGNMLRRSAMEEQQMRRQQERDQRLAEMEDLKLADMMQQAGIREAGPQDIVNRMTGTVQGTIPGQAGGSTGRFAEQPNPEIPPAGKAQGPSQAQVPYLRAEIDPGTLPQAVGVPDDNKYVKFRGKDLVVPGQRERAATAEAAKRRELRLKAEETQVEREMFGLEMSPEMLKALGLPQTGRPVKVTRREYNDAIDSLSKFENIRSQIADREARAQERANPNLHISTVTTDEGVYNVGVDPKTGEPRSKVRVGSPRQRQFAPPRENASLKKLNKTDEVDQFTAQAIDDAMKGGATEMAHVIANVKSPRNYKEIPASTRLKALAALKKMEEEGKQVIGEQTDGQGNKLRVRGTPLPAQPAPSAQVATPVKEVEGATTTYQGATYRFDGKEWKRQ